MLKRSASVLQRRGAWWARLLFTDELTGKRREQWRKARTKIEAIEIRDRLLREFDETNGRALLHERKTVADLVQFYEREYAGPPEYCDGRKIGGLRSHVTIRYQLPVIREHFVTRQVRSITYEDLRRFKAIRLKSPTRSGHQRSIASVNRELSLLRRMLAIALREGWIVRNPFTNGEPLISVSDERQRQRILTPVEETRLLKACDHPQRLHLRAILLCALDTGMRQGEIFKLRWSDVDFDTRRIDVRAFNTKTMTGRQVTMTGRVTRELLSLTQFETGDALVFGVTDNVKRSFAAACRIAGVQNFRFHDLRHTAATRLVQGGLPLPEMARILGHTQLRTTYRYVNADENTTERAASILDAFTAEHLPNAGEAAVN